MNTSRKDFDYPHKSNSEVKRSILVYKLITNAFLVKVGKIFLDLFLRLKLPIKIFTKPVFLQFCGGETLQEAVTTAGKLGKFNIKSIPDYSVEAGSGNQQFDFTTDEIIKTIETARNNDNIPFAVFKPTGLVVKDALEQKYPLYSVEVDNFKQRLKRIFDASEKNNVPVLVDAEDYKYQQRIDEIILSYMKEYNVKETLIFTTLQMYRTDRLAYLKYLIEIAKRDNFKLGIKFVRGAYMESERKEAKKLGYEDPIYKTKQETDDSFDNAIRIAIDNIDIISIFCGTHNYESSIKLCELMSENNINYDSKKVWFSQLYGMSDELTFMLAQKKYNAVKYLPYGPIRKVIPYLIRRAEENSSINSQATKELEILKKTLKLRQKNHQ